MAAVRNVLFIMCDQLRWDVLSSTGLGELVDTPNLDALAARGVRFDRAFIQGSVCGSSRMSFYTGRYVQTHGARYNRIPLSINQLTLGDHLRPLGVRTVLIGKTHHAVDRDGLARLGLDPDDPRVAYVAECGFEAAHRDDGLHPSPPVGSAAPGSSTRGGQALVELAYNRYLRANGFDVPNPWDTVANSVIDQNGQRISGWLLRSSAYPAIVPDELSETAYLVDRAIDFMDEAGEQRWCAHLSFIKPHWPYVVSEPYHGLVAASDIPPAVRSEVELASGHPVLEAFRNSRIGRTFSRDEVRSTVVPAYLGLVSQIDAHLGRLFEHMKASGRWDDTLIVFTSDHGDYLGDHYMGEKDWFHEQIVRVPLIVVDPRAEADTGRGRASSELVEAIDLVPTFVEALGGDLAATEPWLEGRSLLGAVHSVEPTVEPAVEPTVEPTGRAVFCQSDYGFLEMANLLPDDYGPRQRRATMVRTERYKYVLPEAGPALLYDLETDPEEFHDRSADPALASARSELHDLLFTWFRQRTHDVGVTAPIMAGHAEEGATARAGIAIGYWDEADLPNR